MIPDEPQLHLDVQVVPEVAVGRADLGARGIEPVEVVALERWLVRAALHQHARTCVGERILHDGADLVRPLGIECSLRPTALERTEVGAQCIDFMLEIALGRTCEA